MVDCAEFDLRCRYRFILYTFLYALPGRATAIPGAARIRLSIP